MLITSQRCRLLEESEYLKFISRVLNLRHKNYKLGVK